MKRATVAVAARQAGTANAFAPVIDELRRRGAAVLCAAFQPAAGVLQRDGVDCQEVATADEALALWRQHGPVDFVLCGTSEHAVDDARLWGWAAEQAIPHAAFVDSWVNYALRFTTPGGAPFDLAPGAVAVPDLAAAQRMTEAGCPRQLLVVTGSPAFDPWARLDPAPGRRWRRQLLAGEALLCAFVLEPLAEVYGEDPGSDSYLGYTERDALALALEALEPLAAEDGVALAVAPHPRQDPAAVGRMVRELSRGRSTRVELITDHDRFAMVGGADALLGMTSTLLYEATLACRPVVSFQPGRLQGSDLTDLHPQIVVVTEPGEAAGAVQAALSGREVPLRPRETEAATERLVRYILER